MSNKCLIISHLHRRFTNTRFTISEHPERFERTMSVELRLKDLITADHGATFSYLYRNDSSIAPRCKSAGVVHVVENNGGGGGGGSGGGGGGGEVRLLGSRLKVK